MRIDQVNFKERSEKIRAFMKKLHEYSKNGQMPSDKQIIQLGQKFFERDKNIDVKVDIEMLTVIRGFEWGMKAMRQIIEGNKLTEHG